MATNNYLKVGSGWVHFFDDRDEAATSLAVRLARQHASTIGSRADVVSFHGECEPGVRKVGGHTVNGVVMVPLHVLEAEEQRDLARRRAAE